MWQKFLLPGKEQLSAYWKLDETLYSGAKDETGRYNGTLFNLTTSGNGNAWTAGYFGNAIELGVNEGRIDFGTVEIDSNFSVSFWVKPDDADSNSTQIITKGGIPGMDVFRVAKSDENSSLEIYLSLDGTNETRILATSNGLIESQVWTNLVLTYSDLNGTISLFADGQQVASTHGHYFTGTVLSSRFSSLLLGGGPNPIQGSIDDLRVYNVSLDPVDIARIFGDGGGDMNRVTLIGEGQTRVFANQKGDAEFEIALPVENYLSVVKVPQVISMSPIPDLAVGDFPFQMEANSTSGLPVTFILRTPLWLL